MGFNFSKYSDSEEESSSYSSEEEYDCDSSKMVKRMEDMSGDAGKITSPLIESQNQFPSLLQITDAQVMEIQRQLDIYEKVSLTYLLYEDPNIALQQVQICLTDECFNNLTEWVKYEQSLGNCWQEKLLEALTIIQNYEVLKELGFTKKDLCNWFSPLKANAIYVNSLRKSLYRMCEDFTRNDTQSFLLKFGKENFKDLPTCNTEEIYLEIYLLHFEIEFHKAKKEKYYIDAKNPGILIIINNENFYTDIKLPLIPKQLEKRHGTKEDEKNLKETFEKFGFKVVCFYNLTDETILFKIKNEVRNIKDESSIFVAILSHGAKGVIYGSNSIPIEVQKIENIMCCQALAGKPKVLILQSCQGNEVQDFSQNDDLSTDGPSSNDLSVPQTADLLVFWATIPGYAAVRNEVSGSWFIQTLCKVMKEKPDDHFEDICVSVRREVTEKRWNQKGMVSLVKTTFLKSLYLPKFEVK